MRNYILFTFSLFFGCLSHAQEVGKSINASVGYGLSAPYEDIDVYSTGFFAQGEYVFTPNNWIDYSFYAGLIITGKGKIEDSMVYGKSTANAGLLGAKIRITIPIP